MERRTGITGHWPKQREEEEEDLLLTSETMLIYSPVMYEDNAEYVFIFNHLIRKIMTMCEVQKEVKYQFTVFCDIKPFYI